MEILACPVCKSDVELKRGKLLCARCNLEFRIPRYRRYSDNVTAQIKGEDLKLTREKWDEEYKNYYDLTKINLIDDPELKDA